MATPRSRHAARLRAHRRRAQQRARWLALAVAVGVLGVVTLLLTAFGTDRGGAPATAASTTASAPITSTPPTPLVLATVGNLRVQSPIAQDGITAVGFHDAQDGSLELNPVGPQANEGLLARLWHRVTGSSRTGLAWYQLEGGALRTLVVGSTAGTDVYSPVDGTVVAIRSHVVSGRTLGSELELRPSSAPSLVVYLQNVRPDPALAVGANVAAGSSKLGTVVDMSAVERQSLAPFSGDSGNNVSIQVYPSATLGVP